MLGYIYVLDLNNIMLVFNALLLIYPTIYYFPKGPDKGFLLTPGIGCGQTSGVDRAISGAVDPAQEVRDVKMRQQL